MLRMVTRLDGDSWEGFAGFENYFDRNMKPLHLPTEVCYGVDVRDMALLFSGIGSDTKKICQTS